METDNRAQNHSGTIVGRESQYTRRGGAHLGERTTTRSEDTGGSGEEGRKGAEPIQTEDTEQGQPWEDPPEHRGTPRRGDPGESTDQLGREGRNTLSAAKRRPGARRQNKRTSREVTKGEKGGKLGGQRPQEQTQKERDGEEK